MKALWMAMLAIALFGCGPAKLKIEEPTQHQEGNALVLMQASILTPAGYPPADANWKCFGEEGPHNRYGWWIYGDEQGAVQAFSMKPGVCWLVRSWDQAVLITEDRGSDPRYSFSVKAGDVVYVGNVGYSFYFNPYNSNVPEWLPANNATHFRVQVLDDFPRAQQFVAANFPEYTDRLTKRIAKRRRAACFDDFIFLDYAENFTGQSFQERCPEIFRPEWQ